MLTPQDLRMIRGIFKEELSKALSENHEDKILTTEQVVELYNTTKGAIYQLTHTKSIPFHKKGTKLFFSKKELDIFFTNREAN